MANLNENKKFHFIYKTTNLLNGKYYIGMHSTCNLKDGYLGSGACLRHSIRKHGIECFTCEILEFLSDRISLVARERELVNEELIHDEKCMNLKPGGSGGFNNKEHMMKCSAAGNVAFIRNMKENPVLREGFKQRFSVNMKKAIADGTWHPYNHTGLHHSPETITKMKIIHKGKRIGELNGQFGNRWITNGIKNKSIKTPIDMSLYPGWYFGKSGDTKNEHKYITNGILLKQLKIGRELPDGWWYGRVGSGTSGNKWINNGIENKNIKKELVDDYIKNGWKYGCLMKPK